MYDTKEVLTDPRGKTSHETLRAFSHDHFALLAVVKSRLFSLYDII